MDKFTPKEFVDKVEWEEGLFVATHEYGLSAENLDQEADPELYEAMVAYDAWLKSGKEIILRVENSLDRIDDLEEND